MPKLMNCLLFLLLLPSLAAVDVSFRDVDSGNVLSDALVFLTFEEGVLTEYLDASGKVFVAAPQGERVQFLVDILSTPGFDYMGSFVASNAEQTVSAVPVGSLVGIVKDSTENVIPKAALQFQCPAFRLDVTYPELTDDFGSFVAEAVPVGQCRVFASSQNQVGFVDVQIEKGKKQDVVVVLNQKVAEYRVTVQRFFIFFVLFVVLVVLVLGYFWWKARHISSVQNQGISPHKHKDHVKDVEMEKPLEANVSRRLGEILPTLNSKEKVVVQFLLTSGQANQASIRHNTGIPRTSLSRVFTALEQKNIVEIRKVGKVVKVSLTKWVLGKE